MNRLIRIVVLLSVAPLVGCSVLRFESRLSSPASMAVKSEEQIQRQAENLIAQDFINAIIQIEAFVPWKAILYFMPEREESIKVLGRGLRFELHNKFGSALRHIAVQRGYVLQHQNNMGGASVIEYDVYEAVGVQSTRGDTNFVYEVILSGVGFRRTFKISSDGVVQPMGAMQVKGADAVGLEPDDSIFDNQKRLTNEKSLLVSKHPEPEPDRGFTSPLANKAPQVKQVINRKERQNAEPTNSLANATDATSPALLASMQKQNIADTKVSNFERLLAEREKVAEQTLVFSNDSFVMGSYNKVMLNEVMSEFNPDTDIVSIVGCSTGKTNLKNGNAALAIGRANRVKEALLYRGVSHDKILDEGCWSPTANSTPFPNRGVVITVKRGITEPS